MARGRKSAASLVSVIAPAAAWAQHRYQPIMANDLPDRPLEWRRIWIVAFILVAAVATNLLATALSEGEETAPWLGMALWAAILVTSLIARPEETPGCDH